MRYPGKKEAVPAQELWDRARAAVGRSWAAEGATDPAARQAVIDDDDESRATLSEELAAAGFEPFRPQQGHYARDPKVLASHPDADIRVEHIGDLLNLEVCDIRSVRSKRIFVAD